VSQVNVNVLYDVQCLSQGVRDRKQPSENSGSQVAQNVPVPVDVWQDAFRRRRHASKQS